MTLNSNMQNSEFDLPIYDNVGPTRRTSELAEIGEENMMWLNRENENPYVYEDETLNDSTTKKVSY